MVDLEPTDRRHRRRVAGTYDDVRNALCTLLPKIGRITTSDLREALRKLRIKLNSEDLERLTTELIPELGQVGMVDHRLPSISSRSFANHSHVRSIREEIKLKMRDPISRNFRAILKRCKELDSTGSALLEMDSLLAILSDHGIHLSTPEADWLYLKFGQRASGRVGYADLLGSFVTASLDNRRRDGAESAPPILPSVLSGGGPPARRPAPREEDILAAAAECWRPLLATCRALDAEGSKLLPREQARERPRPGPGLPRGRNHSTSRPARQDVRGWGRRKTRKRKQGRANKERGSGGVRAGKQGLRDLDSEGARERKAESEDAGRRATGI